MSALAIFALGVVVGCFLACRSFSVGIGPLVLAYCRADWLGRPKASLYGTTWAIHLGFGWHRTFERAHAPSAIPSPSTPTPTPAR